MAWKSPRVDPGRQPYLRGHSSLLAFENEMVCSEPGPMPSRWGSRTQVKWVSFSPCSRVPPRPMRPFLSVITWGHHCHHWVVCLVSP